MVQQLSSMGEIVQLAPLIKEMVRDPVLEGVSAKALCQEYVRGVMEGDGVVLALVDTDSYEVHGYLAAQFTQDLVGPLCTLGQLFSETPNGGRKLFEELEEVCVERGVGRIVGVVASQQAELMKRYYGAKELGVLLTKEVGRGRNS